ncbi:MAG: TRAP transporter small permease subunit [Pseudomonadota bacterium]
MRGLANAIDGLNDVLGKILVWLTLGIVIIQFVVVLARYLYGAPNIAGLPMIMWQESITYMHAFLFMLCAAYTLLKDGHVRVDIFYREAPLRRKALTNLLGSLFLLLPMCFAVWIFSFDYVARSWAQFEGSQETSGLQFVYILKSAILGFAVLMALQGVSIAIRSLLALQGDNDELQKLKLSGGGH